MISMSIHNIDVSTEKFKTDLQVNRPLVKSVHQKNIFLFLNQNICCEYSKEPSQRDGSFNPKHMLKMMGKKIFTILC